MRWLENKLPVNQLVRRDLRHRSQPRCRAEQFELKVRCAGSKLNECEVAPGDPRAKRQLIIATAGVVSSSPWPCSPKPNTIVSLPVPSLRLDITVVLGAGVPDLEDDVARVAPVHRVIAAAADEQRRAGSRHAILCARSRSLPAPPCSMSPLARGPTCAACRCPRRHTAEVAIWLCTNVPLTSENRPPNTRCRSPHRSSRTTSSPWPPA